MSEHVRIQRKREKAFPSIQSDTLQRSPAAPEQTVDEVPSIVQEVISSSGEPLDTDTQGFMEPRFGHNFSQVRIHADERAAESAQAVDALAYTMGNDVVFGQGQYVPRTDEGRRLLAHELTHVVQQSQTSYIGPLSSESAISNPNSPAEHEACSVADQITTHHLASIHFSPTSLVHRKVHGTHPDASHSEQTNIDVTGNYEAINPSGNNRITVQINQAGSHIEGWWQRRLYSENSDQRLETRSIVGNLSANEPERVVFNYQRFVERGTPASGTLTVTKSGDAVEMSINEGDGSIAIDEQGVPSPQGWSHRFTRTSTASHLSDEAIQAMPSEVRDLVQATENAPLDTSEEKRLVVGCNQIQSFIKEFLDADQGSALRDAIASRMNEYIDKDLMGLYANAQMPLVIRRMREYLVNPTLKGGTTTRPYWDWLQVIVSSSPTYTKDIQNRLEMRAGGPGLNAPQHKYQWTYNMEGFSAGIAAVLRSRQCGDGQYRGGGPARRPGRFLLRAGALAARRWGVWRLRHP